MKKYALFTCLVSILVLTGCTTVVTQQETSQDSKVDLDVNSILTDTHKLDKKVVSEGVTWVGFKVDRNDQDSNQDYELWLLAKDEKPMLVDSFSVNALGGFDWNLNKNGGVNMLTYDSAADASASTDFVFDTKGEEKLRIMSESSKVSFVFQQKNRAETDVSPIFEGKCEGPAQLTSEGNDYIKPNVTLTGIRLKTLATKETVKDFVLNEPAEVKCVAYDGYLEYPGLNISEFDDAGIEFNLPNGQKGTISLKPSSTDYKVSDDPEVIFQ